MLAEKTPACFVAFDLLALGDDVVRRPAVLRAPGGDGGGARRPRRPVLPDPHHHRHRPRPSSGSTQFEGAGLDGVVAKPLGATYQQNARTMLKIKHERTADVVRRRLPRAQDVDARAAAARQPPARPVRRRQAAAHRRLGQLHREAPGRADRGAAAAGRAPIEDHPWGEWAEWAIANPDRVPGTQSRWSAGKDLSFTPLRPGPGPRGRLRPHGGPPVPAHRPVPALAHRPRPGVLRIRAVGGACELRPRLEFCWPVTRPAPGGDHHG